MIAPGFVSVELLIQQILNGIFFGGQLALMAVGLTLIWGVAQVLNFAHGALFMIGGFTGYFALTVVGNFVVAIIAAIVVVLLIGAIVEYALIEPIRGREEFDMASIVLTLGVAFVLENIMRVTVGTTRRSVPAISGEVWTVMGINISVQRLVIFLISIVAIAALFAFITYTKLGLGIRAVAQDSETALLMGVRPKRVYATTFALAAALAGLAGILLAPIFTVHPGVGWEPFLLAFIVVMVGGLGSVRGTLVAAIFLAVVRSVSMIWVSSEGAMVILFAIMIGVLVINPDGFGGWLE